MQAWRQGGSRGECTKREAPSLQRSAPPSPRRPHRSRNPQPPKICLELQGRIRAHLANEEIAEARKAFDGAKVPGEASAAWLMLGAEIGYAEFDYDGAIKACNAAYGVDRELKDLFWTRGRARLQLHPDSLDGIDDLQHAIELGLDTIDARLTLARALIETESATNDEQALKILDEKAFESETPDIQGRAASLRGLYWSLQAVRAEASAIWTARNNALEEAQRALLYAPKSSRVLARCGGLRLALALTPKNKEEALENLATACTLNPRDPMPYRLRGLYYGRNETYVKAQADLEAAIDRGAQDADVYFILTYATVKNLSSQNGLAVKAEAYSKRLLVLAPERPKAHYWHGLAVAKQNRLPGGTAAGRASAKRELDAYYREARGEEKRKARKKLKRVYRDMGFAPPD